MEQGLAGSIWEMTPPGEKQFIDPIIDRSAGAIRLHRESYKFRVWAPRYSSVQLHIVHPRDQLIPMGRIAGGYHEVTVDHLDSESRYFYRLSPVAPERPDPASVDQPFGPHGPSRVPGPPFSWKSEGWRGIPLDEYIIYEIHVGTFTQDGTFQGVIEHLDTLAALGVTALELMPICEFPGKRNWGYDGVNLFAVESSYGGPEALKRLVDECHLRGLAVVLDLVYNHLGPEGNYVAEFGPYFSETKSTPWGSAFNFDGDNSRDVRRFIIENALYWVTEFHVDALRLDAIHVISDDSPTHILADLASNVHRKAEELKRRVYLIAEAATVESRFLIPREAGGYGFDSVWNDRFHKALFDLLTQHETAPEGDERTQSPGYMADAPEMPSPGRVVYIQNHDQVGNRTMGLRLSGLVSFEMLKVAAAAVVLAPCLPMLFMGEDYAETARFDYFIDLADAHVVDAVRASRMQEFAHFGWAGEPPDPQNEQTFLNSRLNQNLRQSGHHGILFRLYRELIQLRKSRPALALNPAHMDSVTLTREKVQMVRRWSSAGQILIIFHFSAVPARVTGILPPGAWRKVLDSEEPAWLGGGSSIPMAIEADTETTLSLQAASVVIFEHDSPAGEVAID